MADDIGVNQTASYTVAADVIGTVGYQRVKLDIGADGTTSGDVGATNPLPVIGTVDVGTIATILGTQIVSVVPGVSVSAVVSGTVTVLGGASVSAVVSGTVSVLGITPVTTQASVSVTGLAVWMNPTQAVVVNTIAAGFSVNALVTGVVSVSVLPAVSISVSAVLGTIITQLGTQIVTLATGASVTLVGAASITGVSVGVVVSGVVSVSVLPAVSISVSAVLGTIITILGTQLVSQVAGAVVGLSGIVPVTTAASVSVSGVPVWLNPTQSVVVSNAASVTVSAPAAGGTGVAVWAGVPIFSPFLLMVTSTVVGSATTVLMTIWTSQSQAGAALTQWPVPSGKSLRIVNIQAACNSSAVTGGSVQIMLNVATASASFTSAGIETIGRICVLQMIVSAGIAAGSINDFYADVAAGQTIAVHVRGSTAAVLSNALIIGYLF